MKKLLAMLLAVCMVLSLAACAAKQPEATKAPTEAPTEAQKPEESKATEATEAEKPALSGSITLMASQNWIKDADRDLFKKFEEETGVEVKVLLTPDNGYETLLGTSLAGGSDAVDMFMFSGGYPMESIGLDEIAVDLSNEPWVDRLQDWAVEANTHGGKLLGFCTWSVDYEGILYNKTLFNEKGWEVPNTWDGFLKLCDTIQADGITPMYENCNGVWHTQSWFYGLTPKVLEEKPDLAAYLNAGPENKWADLQTVRDGLTQIRDFLNHQPAYFVNDGQSEDWFGSYPAMQNRECAMLFTYSSYAAELKANGCTDEFGMFPVPLLDNTVGISNGGGISKYINKTTPNLDACKALLEFLARPENLEYYATHNNLATIGFKDVKGLVDIQATHEMAERSTKVSPVMMMKDLLYWDPDIYKYMQGFVSGETSVDEFINNMDAYRATMFDAVA